MITNFNKYSSVNEKSYFDDYGSIITLLKDKEEFYTFQDAANTLKGLSNGIDENFEDGILSKLKNGKTPYIRYSWKTNGFSYGSKEYLDEPGNNGVYGTKNFYYIADLPEVISLIKNKGKIMPSYNPKTFITENNYDKYSNKYSHIAIIIKNEDELDKAYSYMVKEINPITESNVTDNYCSGIRSYLRRGMYGNFIYYIAENYMRYGSVDYTEEHPSAFNIEKFFTVDELDTVKYLIENDKYPAKPNYNPKKFIYETKTYFDKHSDIVIELKSEDEIIKVYNYINEEINKYTNNPISEACMSGAKRYLEERETPTFIYFNRDSNWMYGTKEFLLNNPSTANYLKIYNVNDLEYIKNLIKNKDILIPTYEPRIFITENFNELLLEKSSLTKLGIPREVMQPIQRDLALSPDAEWQKMQHKKDIIDYLRKGGENLFIQVAIDSIKVIVSYPSPKGTQFFVDNYIYKDTGWAGEFKKQKREYKTLTQLAIDIEPRTNIYRLDGKFSINKQAQRNLMRKEKSFMDFSDKFKTDFLQKFDKILKRISGTNFEKAKDKVTDKAKKIAMENSLLIKGLDNPLNGPNGLSILDEFLYQFEDEYSEYFEERIDIQELAKYFTVEKVMTMFMYYIYTGKILVN